MFGLFVIFDSISRVQNALDLRRCGYSSWKSFLLLPVLSVVLGVIMILNPFGTMETLVMAIGIILIVEAPSTCSAPVHGVGRAPFCQAAPGDSVHAGVPDR